MQPGDDRTDDVRPPLLDYHAPRRGEPKRWLMHPAFMIAQGMLAMIVGTAPGLLGIPVALIYGIVRGIRRDEWWFMVGAGLYFPAIVLVGFVYSAIR
jgi:hypothetical protein